MSQLEATVALLDDFGRGVIETHQALSEVDYSTALRTKATIPVSVITGTALTLIMSLYFIV